MATVRLQKIIAEAGISSRRAAETLIVDGRVRVNGKVVSELGAKADPKKDRVEVDGKRLVAEELVYVVLHKPRGVVATMSDPEGRLTVKDYLKEIAGRVYPVGRLDYATSGVLLATNDGDFAEGLLHPRKEVPKTYVVKVSGVMKPEEVDVWRKGVKLDDGMTKPAKVSIIRFEGDKTWLELTIKEGRNQQIRRMGDATGFVVMRLARTSFAGITSDRLRPGTWRHLTQEELLTLRKAYGVPKSARVSGDASVTHGQGEARRARGGERRAAASSSRGGERRREVTRGRAGGERPAEATPRYGGGAPGRRGLDVRDDWGGGAGRGRSGSREPASQDAPRADLGGGRGARSRTTGTGGGIGAEGAGDTYRLRRGRSGPQAAPPPEQAARRGRRHGK